MQAFALPVSASALQRKRAFVEIWRMAGLGQALKLTNDSFGDVKIRHAPIGWILQSSFCDGLIFPKSVGNCCLLESNGSSQNLERFNLFSFDRHRLDLH